MYFVAAPTGLTVDDHRAHHGLRRSRTGLPNLTIGLLLLAALPAMLTTLTHDNPRTDT